MAEPTGVTWHVRVRAGRLALRTGKRARRSDKFARNKGGSTCLSA
jgi:hypothetical protein